MRQGDHHIFLVDQIFDVNISAVGGDFGTTFVAELVADQLQLFANHFHQTVGAAENVQQLRDLLQQLFIFVEQFFMLKAGQFLQTQIQNRLSLLLGQIVFTVAYAELWLQPFRTRGVIPGALQHRRDVTEIPRLGNQRRFRFCRGRRATDQFDNRVDVGQRNGQRFEDMRPVARFAQFENRTTGHHFTAVAYKRGDDVLQVHDLRLTMVQSYHVDAEGDLQLGLGIEVVKHHFPYRIALHFNHDAHPVFIRLVTQRADAFHAFFFDQLGDFLDQARFVHLIRNFVHDDGFAAGFRVHFHFRARADVHFTATGAVGLFDAATAIDNGGGREIRARNMRHQPFNADVFIVNIRQTAVNHFRQVMRRYVGGHPYGDPGGAVHQQVRNFGRHDVRNTLRTVIVVDEIDRLFFKIGHQLMSDFRQTNFGITHRRGGVAVDGTKVTLAVHQHVTQRERLRHTHDGVVYRGVAVRVVFTDYVTNDTG
ncbi:Uncharacterised protein [Klebsiella pneumoniae]|nr:Uncharacterised protein [Klebsiella pneumoniae]